MPKLIRGLARRAGRLLRGKGRREGGARRYVAPVLGVEGFFRALKQSGIKYSVLRWFESLPQVAPGEDIDILVADEDLERLNRFLRGARGHGIPVDIYSVSGLPGSDFRGIAYFPVNRAQEIIDTSQWQADTVRVPDARRHFLSMAYHALYHKGYSSGLPGEGHVPPDKSRLDHDYAAALQECAKRAGVACPAFTLEGIDKLLAAAGWSPPRDSLLKLAARNAWIRRRFFAHESSLPPYWRGFTVFVIREQGVPYLEEIRSILFDEGYSLLAESALEGPTQQRAAHELRGGNWGRGPFPKSGGLPAHAIAAYDCSPIVPDEHLSSRHPGLENTRIQMVKWKLRDLVNERKRKADRCNIVHSADNAAQAVEYAEVTLGRALDGFEEKIRGMHEAFTTPYPVLRKLSGSARRAKVELVQYNGGVAVCKTFKPGRERFLEREILAREIGNGLPEIGPLLGQGKNHLVMEYHEDHLAGIGSIRPLFQKKKYLPLWVIRRVRSIIAHFRERGLEYIDFRPANLLWNAEKGLRVIDFEFLQQCPTCGGEGSRGAYAWYPIPSTFRGDLPLCQGLRENPYHVYWFSQTGLPRLLCDSSLPPFLLVAMQLMMCVALSLNRLRVRACRIAKAGVKALVRGVLRV